MHSTTSALNRFGKKEEGILTWALILWREKNHRNMHVRNTVFIKWIIILNHLATSETVPCFKPHVYTYLNTLYRFVLKRLLYRIKCLRTGSHLQTWGGGYHE